MTSLTRISRALLPAAAAAAVTFAGTAAVEAQEQPAQAQQPIQTVVITGSYIPRIDKETPSPVTTISAEDIERSGLTTVADVVRTISADNSGTLPTAFPGAFAAGASGVALRGLTVNSTLVLIDGLRAANYALPDDGVRGFVDLNSIQIGTIDRVEVLRDGASSVYGADAIGGVVNVILKKQFQGFTADAQVGDSQHGGGFERHLNFTTGVGDLSADHYNAYVSAEWETNDRIGVGQRGYPFNTTNFTPWGGLNLNLQPGISAGSDYGSVTPGQLVVPGNLLLGVPNPGAVSRPLTPCPATAPQATLIGGNVACNQNQTGYLDDQPPSQRFGITGRFTVQLSDTTKAYLQGSYYNNQSVFPGAPPAQIQSPFPNNTNTIALPVTIPTAAAMLHSISCTAVTAPNANCVLNPNNPFAAAGQYALVNYSFGQELGARDSYINNHNLRLVGDISGLWNGWNWDNSYVINHTWLDYSLTGYPNYTQLLADVSDGTYNFINPGANSAATLAALGPKVTTYDSSDMDTIVFRANRSLATLPGGPLGMAVGAEYRYEAQVDLNFNAPPPEVQTLGFSQALGSRNIQSVSLEFDAPVLESLELDASGRYDHYSDFGSSTVPKAGFKWKPLQSLALRGTYSQGFRAPSFAENGSAEAEGFIPGFGQAGTPLGIAHNNDGYISSYTLGELNLANSSIQPEKSKSYTGGLIWQPLSAFSAAADYYYIKKTSLITPANQNAALAQYATNFTVPAGFTAVFDSPDPLVPLAPPRIVTIAAPYINSAAEYTDGVDFDLNWRLDMGAAGRLTEELSATRILSFVYEQAGLPNLQYAGYQSPYNLSSGAGTPKDRVSLSSTWTKGPVTVTADAYYVGAYKEYGQDLFGIGPNNQVVYTCLTQIINATATPVPGNCRVGSFTTVNLTGSYQINAQWQINAVIENVADKLPPVDLPSYNGVNYNSTYSQAGIVGRFFRLGFKFML
jgi:iron complex outermembrane receptor protein